MAREKGEGKTGRQNGPRGNHDVPSPGTPGDPIPPAASFLRDHALSAILFLAAFFLILAVTNPAIYMTDEWITANQLHQVDLGHQVTFSEGKYGVTENGSVSGYITARQNVLMYSLALPLSALPAVRLFGLFGDNFRMLVILLWSLCLVLIAFLLDTYYPEYAKVCGIRLFFPLVLVSLLLFMANILLYKQFPFSAPDAPFEVAALVLTNHVFFALTVAVIFEIFQAIRQDTWLSLFGTAACTACSSYLFWAGNCKDHMLVALLFACVILFCVLFRTRGLLRDAFLSFVFCGLLIWVRPEVGFFVTIFAGAVYGFPLVSRLFRRELPGREFARQLLPMAGAFIGGIPFFLNNLVTTRNLLIPAFDLPRPLVESTTTFPGPLPLQEVTNNLELVNQTAALGPAGTLVRVAEMISHALLRGFTFENLIQGFTGVMFFPQNGNIGFAIMCPLVILALFALVFWYRKIRHMEERERDLCLLLFILGIAAIFSYLPKLGAMSMSTGILPDMRYLSPAYIPLGILSILILSKTPVLASPREMFSRMAVAGIVLTPLLFLLMIVVHPFGAINEGYTLFFEATVVLELVLAFGLMVLARVVMPKTPVLYRLLPWTLILLVITVFAFQLVLVFIFGVIVKINGYPLWLPLMREGFRTVFSVNVIPPA